jgi:putative hydrolase of the HAD superfamily
VWVVAVTIDVMLFDLGGVLVDYVGFQEIGALLSEAVTPGELQERWRACGAEGFETGHLTPAEFASALNSVLAFNVPEHEFLRHFESWSVGFIPGAVELLAELRPHYRLAALSNSNELHWRRNAAIGVQDEFEIAMSSHELHLRKPDRAIYEEALRRLNVPAARVVFFDDMEINVEAALEAGMQAHRVVGIEGLQACLQENGYLKPAGVT